MPFALLGDWLWNDESNSKQAARWEAHCWVILKPATDEAYMLSIPTMSSATRSWPFSFAPWSMQAASSEPPTDLNLSGYAPVRFPALAMALRAGKLEGHGGSGCGSFSGAGGARPGNVQTHARNAGLNAPDISAIWALFVYGERMRELGQCLSLAGACSGFLSGDAISSPWKQSFPSIPSPSSSFIRPWRTSSKRHVVASQAGDGGPAGLPQQGLAGRAVQVEGDSQVLEDLNVAASHLRGDEVGGATEDWVVDGEFLNSGSAYRLEENTTTENGWDTESEGGLPSDGSISGSASPSGAESAAIAAKEPLYNVLEVKPGGKVMHRVVSRRQLLRSSDLRLRDMRRIDPSLWSTTSLPGILVRNRAILLNLGSLRAIATPENVLVFDQNSIGAQAFLDSLLPRISADNSNGPNMPFELEVVEAALISRTQRLENSLQEVEPRVTSLLEVLPNKYTADGLEELRLSKQALVELGSKAGALQQMLLELLESQEEIQRISIMGLKCNVERDSGVVECEAFVDKQAVDSKEEEIEMLLEFYLQRCDSCHGQAEKLLDAAREMEDSISVNLSSRRLEVSRLELLLQVATFCAALGALVAGIFGMNLKSYLEEHVLAFWFTTAGILLGGLALFVAMFSYLRTRRIL